MTRRARTPDAAVELPAAGAAPSDNPTRGPRVETAQPASEPAGAHPTSALDDTVHQRTRLGILAVLAEGHRVQFGALQKTLGLTDGNLSRHVSTLADAGLLTMEKGYADRRPRTWVIITKAGTAALKQEIALLRKLIDQVEPG